MKIFDWLAASAVDDPEMPAKKNEKKEAPTSVSLEKLKALVDEYVEDDDHLEDEEAVVRFWWYLREKLGF